MAGYSADHAMREYLRRGSRDQTGLDDLARRVAEKRRELLQRHSLDGTLREVRELLDRAVLEERKQLARDLDDDARLAEMRIESLPPSTARRPSASCPTTRGAARPRGPTTNGSRTCSAARPWTSGSPA